MLSAQSYCGGESLVGMLSAVGKQVLWRRIMADETWEAQVFGKTKRKIVKMKQTFILLSALCAAVLVGCGGKGDSAQNGENGNNGGKQWKPWW